MGENKLYYILTSSIRRNKFQKDVIEVEYSNGLDKIIKEYKLGEYIETIINIEDE